jgi:rubrerythrin
MRPISPGVNRTGIAASPGLAAALVQATSETVPSSSGDAEAMAAVRLEYSRHAEPAGSMPLRSSFKDAVRATGKAQGKSQDKRAQREDKRAQREGKRAQREVEKSAILADKLGERLAFERSGVRLYDALLSKLDAFGTWPGGPSRGDLEQIRAAEREHFLLLRQCMVELGSDPTAVTPSANAHAVMAQGLPALLADPRSDLHQGLEAILVAELVDNDGWETLIDLARAFRRDEMALEFDAVLAEEREHLRRVRRWIAAGLLRESTTHNASNGHRTARRQATTPARSANHKKRHRPSAHKPSAHKKRAHTHH